MSIIGWIIIGVVVLLLLFAIAIYNRLVRLRALVKEGFSGITVQLRRRADLIPNLVEAVKGYATPRASDVRGRSPRPAPTTTSAERRRRRRPPADATMTGLIGRLFAVAEAYPELKANENFRQLQDRLARDRDRTAERAALLQRHRARPQHAHPELPGGADRAAAGLQRGALLRGSTDASIQTAPKVSFDRPAA